MTIRKLWDGEGNNYEVGVQEVTKIEETFWYVYGTQPTPISLSSPCFLIYKNDKRWRKFYSPKIIVEYD